MTIETVPELLEIARQHGLELSAQVCDFDRTGLDFLVVHAEDKHGVRWVVRTPRRPEVFESTLKEARVLSLLKDRLPAKIPDWRVHEPELIAYPRLSGTPAVTVADGTPTWNIIDPKQPSELFIASFARAIVAMQNVPRDALTAADIPTKTIPEVKTSLARTLEATHAVLDPSGSYLARWQAWLNTDKTWPDFTALVHGDLHPGHMLLNDKAELTGILDWTEAMVSDPSVDLAMFYGCFGKAALERLIVDIEKLGGKTWPHLAEHAVERWVFMPLLSVEWALRTNNEAVIEHSRMLLQNLPET